MNSFPSDQSSPSLPPFDGGSPTAPDGGADAAASIEAHGAPLAPQPSENDMLLAALQGLFSKWDKQESTMAGEKSSLLETLMMLAGSEPATPQEAMVEGGPENNFGMTAGAPPLPQDAQGVAPPIPGMGMPQEPSMLE